MIIEMLEPIEIYSVGKENIRTSVNSIHKQMVQKIKGQEYNFEEQPFVLFYARVRECDVESSGAFRYV